MDNILQIDKSILRDHGVAVSSYLFMLIISYYPGTKIDIPLGSIIELGFINGNSNGYFITEDGLRFIDYVNKELKSAAKAKKATPELVESMRSLFPEGKKSGTNKYWRDNSNNILKKLNTFFKTYGDFPDELILDATKKYVDSFGDNNQLMRIIPYFILKDDNSELMTIIDNIDSVKSDSQNELWASVLM